MGSFIGYAIDVKLAGKSDALGKQGKVEFNLARGRIVEGLWAMRSLHGTKLLAYITPDRV